MTQSISLILLTGCLAGCASSAQPSPVEVADASNLAVAATVKQAVNNNDFRLLALASRRLVFAGLEDKNTEQLKQLCGVRFIKNSSDVLKSEQDKQAYLDNYQFAKQYNLIMLPHCQQADR